MDIHWHDLLPHNIGNITFENKSIDVVIRGCFNYFDTAACVRNALLTFLGLCSLLLCIICIIKLHVLQYSQIHQYLIFYFASFEILFLILKWIILSSLYQMEFLASFLKMMQFIILCHFNWSLVSRILHQQKLINWIIVPLLGVFLIFFTSISVLGMITHFSSWVDCLAPHWLLLSFAEFLGIQLYVVAGIYITRNINSVAALESFKREQKRDLWSVIATYEFSSVVTLAYYITVQALGTHEIGCSGIFNHTQNIYSPVYATFMVIKYLLPIWVMLVVYYPHRSYLYEEERPPWWSMDGSTTSMFGPDTRYQSSYKQLVEPFNDAIYSDQPGLRRSASSPALFPQPALSPISEENPILPPSRINYVNYGALDSHNSQPQASVFHPPRTRSRHDSGQPSKGVLRKTYRVPVSLNQCSDEMESVTPSSGERA